MRLDPIRLDAHESIKGMLKFFMGKNTPERQQYIIRNLRFEHDIVAEDEDAADAEPIAKSSDDADASSSQAA